jgi:Raf kinase inhibitor-like YbhB/YbcL family protein
MPTIPSENTCAGANLSPELDWTPGPAGTKSYALVLRDLCNTFNHWAVWDIPASEMKLPVTPGDAGATLAMPAGAKEVNFMNSGGYRGPCPSGQLHTYQFTLYALDVAALAPMPATVDRVFAILSMQNTHVLATAKLAGTSNAQGHF